MQRLPDKNTRRGRRQHTTRTSTCFSQENAWADQKKFCMEWAKKSYREGLMRGRGGLPKARSILIMDNLHAQTTDGFKEYLAKHCNTLAWYGPSECSVRMRCSQSMQEPDDFSR